jgi:hypothetical protein
MEVKKQLDYRNDGGAPERIGRKKLEPDAGQMEQPV